MPKGKPTSTAIIRSGGNAGKPAITHTPITIPAPTPSKGKPTFQSKPVKSVPIQGSNKGKPPHTIVSPSSSSGVPISTAITPSSGTIGKPPRRNIVPPMGATGSKPPPVINTAIPNIPPTQGFQGVSRRSNQPRNVFTRINNFLIRAGLRSG